MNSYTSIEIMARQLGVRELTEEEFSIVVMAHVNPMRYRGYYWDIETGLYYLKSRYYDAQVGRFINADCISELRPDVINGLNLFTYCLNNPIRYVDSNGRSPVRNINIADRWLDHINPNRDIPFATFNMRSSEQFIISDLGFAWGQISYTVTTNYGQRGIFFSYAESIIGSSAITYGAGINLFEIVGVEGNITFGGGNFGMGVGISLGAIGIGVGVGMRGISLSGSLSSGDITNTGTIEIGWGTVGVATMTSLAVITAPKWIPVAASLIPAVIIFSVVGWFSGLFR